MCELMVNFNILNINLKLELTPAVAILKAGKDLNPQPQFHKDHNY
jgi:hypothetical protein